MVLHVWFWVRGLGFRSFGNGFRGGHSGFGRKAMVQGFSGQVFSLCGCCGTGRFAIHDAYIRTLAAGVVTLNPGP